jgi:hypothetical protein
MQVFFASTGSCQSSAAKTSVKIDAGLLRLDGLLPVFGGEDLSKD